jgi:hypothetical protein
MTTIAFALFNLPAFLTDPHPLGPPELNYLLVLIPYHVLLLIAIIAKGKDARLSKSISATVLIHTIVLGVLIALVVERDLVPSFYYIRYFIALFAPFEAKRLFLKDKKIVVNTPVLAPSGLAPSGDVVSNASADDSEEFIRYLKERGRQFHKPGRSVREEFTLWLNYRIKHGIQSTSPPLTMSYLRTEQVESVRIDIRSAPPES